MSTTTDTITVADMEEAIAQREAELIAEHEAFKANIATVGLKYNKDYGYNGIIPLLKEIGIPLPKTTFRGTVTVRHYVTLEAEDSNTALGMLQDLEGDALGELVLPEGITKREGWRAELYDTNAARA